LNAGALGEYLAVFGKIPPRTIEERFNLALATVHSGDPFAVSAIADLEKVLPDSRPVLAALAAWSAGDLEAEITHLCAAVAALRRTPWLDERLLNWLSRRLFHLANTEATRRPADARRLFDALAAPLPENRLGETRPNVLTLLAMALTPQDRRTAVESWGQPFPFAGHALAARLITYAESGHAGLRVARKDLQRFLRLEGGVPPELHALATALLECTPGAEASVVREFTAGR
jgi:hypothetical protein